LEFDAGGRLGSDLVRTSGILAASGNGSAVVAFAAAWGGSGIQPNVLFECTDGTFGSFNTAGSGYIGSALNFPLYSNASTPDERALAIIPPVTMTINAISGMISNTAGTGDFEIVIYQGTTVVHTQIVDGHTLAISDNRVGTFTLSSNVTLTEGLQYYIALRPTTSTNVRWYSLTVYNGQSMRNMGYPATTGEATRTDGGTWSAIDTTRLPLVCLHICDVAAGGSTVIVIED
jgi:hypothetical protein